MLSSCVEKIHVSIRLSTPEGFLKVALNILFYMLNLKKFSLKSPVRY